MSLCYKTSNNKYFDCPPRMNDGRHFTDYTSNGYTNNIIRTSNNIQNNFEYRQFLTNNAEKIMDMNRAYSCQKNCCGKSKELHKNTMLPEQSLTMCNSENCKTLITNENGLGNGRYYGINPTMDEINNRTKNCSNWSKGLPINQPKNSCSKPVSVSEYSDSGNESGNESGTESESGYESGNEYESNKEHHFS
jgi:hypothetical protein